MVVAMVRAGVVGTMVDQDGEWVSVSEGARRLGISRSAIRNRISRKTIPYQTDNHGNPRVLVHHGPVPPVAHGPVPPVTDRPGPSGPGPELGPQPPRQDQPDSVPWAVHREAVERLQAASDAERARHDAEVERLVGQIHAERSFWIERADRAELVAEHAMSRADDMARRMAEMAEQASRPWFARWFGQSKRSKLGGLSLIHI